MLLIGIRLLAIVDAVDIVERDVSSLLLVVRALDREELSFANAKADKEDEFKTEELLLSVDE